MDLGNGGIRMINTSSKTFEATKKTYKIMHKSKTQDGTKPGAKIMKKQGFLGDQTLHRTP